MAPIKSNSGLRLPGTRRAAKGVSGALLAVCLVLVMAAGVSPTLRRMLGGTMQPVLSGGAQTMAFFRDTVRSVMPLSAMERRMLGELQERVYQLQTELAVAGEAVEENRELREFLELSPPPGWRRLPAFVIARDPISWNQRFRIDRGARDGVVPGALVMVGENAVGRVLEVTARSALVATVVDPECRLSVRLQEHRGTGIMVGGHERDPATGKIRVLIDFLPRDGPYQVDELVETSGLSGFVPGGIQVAQVVAWDKPDEVVRVVDSAFARMQVVPLADINNFRVVAVLLPASEYPANGSR